MRLVLDTNVLVSAFVSAKGASTRILTPCRIGKLELLISPDSLAELRRALTYPRLRQGFRFSDRRIDAVVTFL